MNKIMHPIEPEELMAYLDGELSTDRAAETAAHLGECAECQSLVADLRGVSHTLKAWEVGQPQSHLPQPIASALSERNPERGRVAGSRVLTRRKMFGVRWQTAEWIGALAVVFLVVVGTVRFIGGNADNVFSTVSEDSRPAEHLDAQTRVHNQRPSTGVVAGLAKNANDTPTELREQTIESYYVTPDQQRKSAAKEPPVAGTTVALANGPMVIRNAQLSLITKEFDKARAALEATLKRHRSYLGEMKVGGLTGSGRTLSATLRVPADQLDATLVELKTLGRVESESQTGQDVTSQYVDLQARLANARNTEQRLIDLLRNRTGKLSDVLEVEQEVDRVRGEIERMEAERKNMSNQVSFATLNATITEDYKAQLQVVPPSTSTRLSNAAVEGYKSMVEGVVSLVLFLLSSGPSFLFWGALLFFPARLVWKRVRRSFAQ